MTIKNHRFKNVKDFVLSSEEPFALQAAKVLNTTSIDAGSVSVKRENDRLLVTRAYLPKGEKIEIEIITDRRLSFWKVRGHGDQYRLQSNAYLEGFRSALSFVLWMLSITLIVSLVGALIGLIAVKS